MSRCRRRATSLRAPNIRGRGWAGRGSCSDIVDYEMIATIALLDAAADRREALLHEIYEINPTRSTWGKRASSDSAIRRRASRF